MKKTILSLIALFGISLLMQAQTKTMTPSKPATDKMNTVVNPTHKKAISTTVKSKKDAVTQTPETKDAAKSKTTVATTTVTGPAKKDGTPDMHYKANKEKPAVPLKKDGTPDKRYKANKSK